MDRFAYALLGTTMAMLGLTQTSRSQIISGTGGSTPQPPSIHIGPIAISYAELVLAGLGIVGTVVAAWVFYHRGQRFKRITFKSVTQTLLGRSDQSLPAAIKMQYINQPIESLSRTLIVFWSSGNETIDKSDIARTDPFRIVMDTSKLLNASVRKVRRNVNEITVDESAHLVAEDPNAIPIEFEFLDKNDGALIEVLHTGSSHLGLAGTFKGMDRPLVFAGRLTRNVRHRWMKGEVISSFWSIVMSALFFFLGIGLVGDVHPQPVDWLSVLTRVSLIFTGSFGIIVLAPLVCSNFYHSLGVSHPPELDDPVLF
jgi:hypothetical protein